MTITWYWLHIYLKCPLLPESIYAHGCYFLSSLPLSLSLYLDFALTEVICSSGNGSIMSSDLLAKCLPCILSAIQSSLGLASAYWRVKFHMDMVLRGILRNTLPAREMPNHYRWRNTNRNTDNACWRVVTSVALVCNEMWPNHMAKNSNG